MIIVYIAAGAVIALAAAVILIRQRHVRRQRITTRATESGVLLDDKGNIRVSGSLAKMLAREEITGQTLTGKEAEFKELLRMVAEGPETIEEIRFLIRKGFEPVVRPDGKVYVPCEENEHLHMAGELPLAEEDLEPCRNIEL